MAGSFILYYNCCGSPLLSESILTVSSGRSKATKRGFLSVLHSHLIPRLQRRLKPRPSTRHNLETWQASHPTGMFYMATFGKLSMGSRVLVTNALLTHSFLQYFMLGSNYVITVISGIVLRCCGGILVRLAYVLPHTSEGSGIHNHRESSLDRVQPERVI